MLSTTFDPSNLKFYSRSKKSWSGPFPKNPILGTVGCFGADRAPWWDLFVVIDSDTTNNQLNVIIGKAKTRFGLQIRGDPSRAPMSRCNLQVVRLLGTLNLIPPPSKFGMAYAFRNDIIPAMVSQKRKKGIARETSPLW